MPLIIPECSWPTYVYGRGHLASIPPRPLYMVTLSICVRVMNSHFPSILKFNSCSLMLASAAVGPPLAMLWPNHCRHHQTHTSIDHDDAHWWGGALDGLRDDVKQLGRPGQHGLSGSVRGRTPPNFSHHHPWPYQPRHHCHHRHGPRRPSDILGRGH